MAEENEDIKDSSVHGYKVYYQENAEDGKRYLDSHLSYDEAEVFFYFARSKTEAKFRAGSTPYSLRYEGGRYTLIRH